MSTLLAVCRRCVRPCRGRPHDALIPGTRLDHASTMGGEAPSPRVKQRASAQPDVVAAAWSTRPKGARRVKASTPGTCEGRRDDEVAGSGPLTRHVAPRTFLASKP